MTERLPSIMGLERDPFIDCPLDPGLRCNCYKTTPCPDCPLKEVHSIKRVKVKGHYRVIARDIKGRIISSKKWHSAKRDPIRDGNTDEMS